MFLVREIRAIVDSERRRVCDENIRPRKEHFDAQPVGAQALFMLRELGGGVGAIAQAAFEAGQRQPALAMGRAIQIDPTFSRSLLRPVLADLFMVVIAAHVEARPVERARDVVEVADRQIPAADHHVHIGAAFRQCWAVNPTHYFVADGEDFHEQNQFRVLRKVVARLDMRVKRLAAFSELGISPASNTLP